MAGYQERIRTEMTTQDKLNHTLGFYVATGVNAPKKYPKHPFMEKFEKSHLQPMTDEEMAAAAKRSAAQWKGLENGGNTHR